MFCFIKRFSKFYIILLYLSNSNLSPVKAQTTRFIWTGGVTDSSISFRVRVSHEATIKIAISTDSLDYSNSIESDQLLAADSLFNIKSLTFTELQSNKQYFYQVLINGSKDTSEFSNGKFKTLSSEPAFSYKIVVASCSNSGNNSDVFRTIAFEEPLIFLQTGDFHYGNIETNCDENMKFRYEQALRAPNQSFLYRRIPIAYMWDDHDYGPNNGQANAPCRMEARRNYHLFVPHYPLSFGINNYPISQTFDIGRIRFILPDLRSEKIEPVYQGCDRISQGTNFGYQIDWFKETLLKAKSEGKVVAWISGIPFINHPGGPNYECNEDDDWGGYPEERMEIANFIRDNEISIFILAGDAHMLSIDNGTNSDYSHQGGAPIPVFHAGPLYQTPSYKGGPYSHGISLMNEQYGVMEVVDEGLDSINIKWTGKNKLNQVALNEQGEPIQYEFSFYLGKITTLDENKLTKFDVVVFPNPNNDQLHLEFDGNLPQKAKIRIFALTGGLVLEESLIIENKVSIISHNLTPGTYYFELVIKKEIFQKKLVIAR